MHYYIFDIVNAVFLNVIIFDIVNGACDRSEGKEAVLDNPLHEPLTPTATAAERRARQPTLDTSVQVTCLILACMTLDFQKRFDGMDAYNIIVKLKTMFQKHARLERFESHRKLLECKRVKGKPVGLHVFNLIGHFQIMEKLGFPYPEGLAIDIVINSLHEGFKSFRLNFFMQGGNTTLNLPNELEREHKEVLMVRKGKSFKKVGTGPYSRKDKGNEVVKSASLGKVKANPKPKFATEHECFYYKEIDHWKRNCPKYLEDKKNDASTSGIFFIELNLATSASWVFDTGCGTHIICNVQGLKRSIILEKREVDLGVGNEARVDALAMTRSPFTGTSERANDVLAVIHTDVCRPMSTLARGGYSYFITFTDDVSRYGYVYLMRHKSESFEKFKQFKNEVQNQIGKKIKALRSDRGGEYFSQEFDDHLKDCGIVSQLTPPGAPQLNGVSERRNRTLLDMVRSMKSLADLPVSFW
ncbi:hypothetical protein RND81_12G045300 [Saponaria officinalis]|uniref:Integrase catalytic domain-containing protein n=1 Tax=Saponaria officinalis TaxID=3572 RepID=A0AAW1H5U1_SAPOF